MTFLRFRPLRHAYGTPPHCPTGMPGIQYETILIAHRRRLLDRVSNFVQADIEKPVILSKPVVSEMMGPPELRVV